MTQQPLPDSGRPTTENLRHYAALSDLFKEQGPMTLAQAAAKLKTLKIWKCSGSDVTKLIDKLEKVTRLTLFSRRPGNDAVRPTSTGVAYAREVAEVLDRLDQVSGPQEAPRSRLRIGATNALLTYLFPYVFLRLARDGRFWNTYPDLDLEFVRGEHADFLQLLTGGNIAFAVGPEPADRSVCETSRLLELRKTLLYPKDTHDARIKALQGATSFDVNDLADLPLCLVPADHEPTFHAYKIPGPNKGQHFILPTYALGRIWVKFGLAVALAHDTHVLLGDEGSVGQIDVSDQLGTLWACLYFATGGEEKLEDPARDLVAAIRATCDEYVQNGRRWAPRETGTTPDAEKPSPG